ncbi:hypothetical protein Cantr_08820 [Candida viswanathii]|uniref:histone acetyltransferase n=1 Tax=Candida viswanathii TaxID=5486 RepID=A0A367YAG1_9ASCO|nr:hypothetical protein Cantr_08820 [Candida viswanathii]
MSIDSILLDVLPRGEGYENLYFQTNPAYVNSPIHIPKSTSKPDTVKVRHFYSLLHNNVIILGLEVFVYLQIYENHTDKYIYVSKCDTTGLEKLPFKMNAVLEPVLKYMIDYNAYKVKPRQEKSHAPPANPSTYFRLKKLTSQLPEAYPSLKYYNDLPPKEPVVNYRSLPALRTTKLYVFTRPAKEYLFPNSSANPNKHLISGSALLHWWLKIIDRITGGWQRKLLVPGLDSRTFIKRYENWEDGHIFEATEEGSAVNAIPIFPDDPKGRFLEQLVVENRISKMLISRFMMELSYRQEFLGDTVGIIGCFGANAANTAGDDQPVNLISIREYKDFINNVKLIDFTNVDDVTNFIADYKSSLE